MPLPVDPRGDLASLPGFHHSRLAAIMTISAQQSQTTPKEAPSDAPMISVIMPVRNEAKHIHDTLTQIIKQDYPVDAFEVLVVDGESTDGTRAIVEALAKKHPQVRLLANPNRWSSAARNVGVQAAKGNLILIVDGHCHVPDEHLLEAVADAFKRSGADCLGRPQPQDIQNASSLQRAIAAARSSWLGHHPSSFIYSSEERIVPAHSVAVAYRKEVFDDVGLFDESFDACEDVELNHRVDQANLRCLFTPKIAVHYEPRGSLRGLFRQLVRYGRGRVRLLRKHKDTLSLASLVPALFLLGLVVGLPLSLAAAPLAWVYWGVLGLYAFAIISVSLGLAAFTQDWRVSLWAPAVFVTIHIATGWGLIREAILPGRNPFAKSRTENKHTQQGAHKKLPAKNARSAEKQPQEHSQVSSVRGRASV